jgi:ankyrin repeat protein
MSIKNLPKTIVNVYREVTIPDYSKNFFKACINGDIVSLKDLLMKYPTGISLKDEFERSLLYLSCYSGNLDCVKFIYECDPSQIGIKDKFNQTAFLMSCFVGNLDCVKFIYEHDPSQIGIKNNVGSTPFLASCRIGNLDCVKFIYEKDPSQIKNKNVFNETLFYVSCCNGHFDCANFIYEKDPSQINSISDEQFAKLISLGNNSIIELIQKSKEINKNLVQKVKNNYIKCPTCSRKNQPFFRIYSTDLEKSECNICLGDCVDPYSTQCGHVLCKKCLETIN